MNKGRMSTGGAYNGVGSHPGGKHVVREHLLDFPDQVRRVGEGPGQGCTLHARSHAVGSLIKNLPTLISESRRSWGAAALVVQCKDRRSSQPLPSMSGTDGRTAAEHVDRPWSTGNRAIFAALGCLGVSRARQHVHCMLKACLTGPHSIPCMPRHCNRKNYVQQLPCPNSATQGTLPPPSHPPIANSLYLHDSLSRVHRSRPKAGKSVREAPEDQSRSQWFQHQLGQPTCMTISATWGPQTTGSSGLARGLACITYSTMNPLPGCSEAAGVSAGTSTVLKPSLHAQLQSIQVSQRLLPVSSRPAKTLQPSQRSKPVPVPSQGVLRLQGRCRETRPSAGPDASPCQVCGSMLFARGYTCCSQHLLLHVNMCGAGCHRQGQLCWKAGFKPAACQDLEHL